jgi:hypothetical protein
MGRQRERLARRSIAAATRFVPPVPGQRIEVRGWTDGRDTVNVYRARIQDRSE